MLGDCMADICKKSELALFKHPASYWGTGCCSSSAGEIATFINRLHPGRFGLKSSQSTNVVAVYKCQCSGLNHAGIYNTASATNTLEKGD